MDTPCALLLRPDRYIAGVAKDGAALASLLERHLARLSGHVIQGGPH
ncbi:MAG: hypothetical protein NTV17_04640 [Burkholderiales bacterium]|nr:hypothetical protein [Burkholderiales bacterium]